MKTKVIHIRNKQGHSNEVYIGRGGPFGNPIPIGKPCPRCGERHDREGCLVCYREYLQERLENDPHFKQAVLRLKGKTLVCFCKPQACHGDILAQYVDTYQEDLP